MRIIYSLFLLPIALAVALPTSAPKPDGHIVWTRRSTKFARQLPGIFAGIGLAQPPKKEDGAASWIGDLDLDQREIEGGVIMKARDDGESDDSGIAGIAGIARKEVGQTWGKREADGQEWEKRNEEGQTWGQSVDESTE